jgi:hypothetical protein
VQAEATTGPGAAAGAAGASTPATHGATQAAGRRRVHDAEGPDPRVQAMLTTSDGGAHGGSQVERRRVLGIASNNKHALLSRCVYL